MAYILWQPSQIQHKYNAKMLSHSLFYVLNFMPRKVSKLCAILAKIVTKFYNTAKKDVQWDFKLFNRVSCAVRILIENVLHPPILKAGIYWQVQNAGKLHHLWQKEVGSKSHFHFHHTHLQIILRTIVGYSALFCGTTTMWTFSCSFVRRKVWL